MSQDPVAVRQDPISRDRAQGTLQLDQQQYIKELLSTYSMTEAHSKAVPMAPGTKLVKEGDALDTAHHSYSALVGSLLYLSCCTRPDIAYAVGALARHMASPTQQHWAAAKTVLSYLKGTASQGLVFGGNDSLQGYCDADYAGDKDTARSTTGYVFTLHGAAISWSSRLQPTVAMSTAEAEYMAASGAVKEAVWLRKLMQHLGLPGSCVNIMCDNQAALQLLNNPMASARSKHISVHHHFARERAARGEVMFTYCSTSEMAADVMTKPLAAVKLGLQRGRCVIAGALREVAVTLSPILLNPVLLELEDAAVESLLRWLPACTKCAKTPAEGAKFYFRQTRGYYHTQCVDCHSKRTSASYAARCANDEGYRARRTAAQTEAMQQKLLEPCYYCNFVPPDGDTINGLDRFDSQLGYSDANTVACCPTCNIMKGDRPAEEFLQKVRRIAMFLVLGVPIAGPRSCLPNVSGWQKGKADRKDDFLTVDQKVDLWASNCRLCGQSPAFGIDRVDASSPYTPENTRSCCTICNVMKNIWPLPKFLKHIKYIQAHTQHWLLHDDKDLPMLSFGGLRVPVRVTVGGQSLIFPSAKAVYTMTGKRAISRHTKTGKTVKAVEAPVRAYREQRVVLEVARQFILALRSRA
ncbi:hypothetical protein QJQ45_001053 [Haematococcus lacustris]|nr:hypothetical protein QJQ45_001053 [Haematococcus lacustris]